MTDLSGRGPSRSLSAACVCVLLASCGGGSGGDDGNQPPPPPPPAGELQPLDLSAYSERTYFQSTFDAFSSNLQFALIGVSTYQIFAGRTAPLTQPCDDGGNLVAELDDRDTSGTLSDGDRVTLTYSRCAGGGSVLNAVMNIDFKVVDVHAGSPISIGRTRAAAAGDVSRLVFDFDLQSFRSTFADGAVSLSGVLGVDYVFDDREDHFLITTDDLTTALDAGTASQTVTQRDTTQDYRIDNETLRYTLGMDGRTDVTVGAVKGYFTFETGEPLSGLLNNYPGSGQLTVHGADDDYIRAEPGPSNGSYILGTFYEPDGSGGETDISFQWDDVMDFSVLVPQRRSVDTPVNLESPQVQTLAGRRIDLGSKAFDLVVDTPREAMYLSVPERNELVTISTVDYGVVQRLRIGSRPSGLALSGDGTTLYVANEGNGTISVLNLTTHNVGTIDVQGVLGSANAHTIVETQPGILFLSGAAAPNQPFGGDVLVRIDRNAGDEMHRIEFTANRSNPTRLFTDPQRRFLYRQDFYGLLQFDAADPQVPLLHQFDFFGSTVTNTPLEFSPDGSHILVYGNALRADNLEPDPDFPLNVGQDERWTLDGRRVWGSTGNDSIVSAYNAQAGVRVADYQPECFDDGLLFFTTFRPVTLNGEWAFLKNSTLCIVSTLTPNAAPGVESASPPQVPVVEARTDLIPLGSPGVDIVVNDTTHRAYVSLPQVGEVAIVDTASLALLGSVSFAAGQPNGLALSADGATLYVSLTSPMGLAYVDTSSASVTRVADLSDVFFLDLVDITVVGANDLILSGRFGLTGLVELQPNSGDAHSQILPLVNAVWGTAVSPDAHWLYATDNFTSPTRLMRIDLTQPSPVIVSPNDSFSQQVPPYIAISPDGSRLYLPQGAVVDSSNFHQIGVLGKGLPYVEAGGQKLRIGIADFFFGSTVPARLFQYDAQTFLPTQVSDTACEVSQDPELHPAENQTRWLMLAGDSLCVVTPEH